MSASSPACARIDMEATWRAAKAAGWTDLRENVWHGQPCEHCGKRHGLVRLSGMPPGEHWNSDNFPNVLRTP